MCSGRIHRGRALGCCVTCPNLFLPPSVSASRFIQHSHDHELTPLLSNDDGGREGEDEVWSDALSPGQVLSDFRPDPNVAIPLPPPPTVQGMVFMHLGTLVWKFNTPIHRLSTDSGRIPNQYLETRPPSPRDREGQNQSLSIASLFFRLSFTAHV